MRETGGSRREAEGAEGKRREPKGTGGSRKEPEGTETGGKNKNPDRELKRNSEKSR